MFVTPAYAQTAIGGDVVMSILPFVLIFVIMYFLIIRPQRTQAKAREAMLAIGCIQALRCHTGHCPTGVATQNRWLMSGLDPMFKGARLANYVVTLRKELLQLSRACGVPHPALITTEHFDIIDDRFGAVSATERFQYEPHWSLPSAADRELICKLMQMTPASFLET